MKQDVDRQFHPSLAVAVEKKKITVRNLKPPFLTLFWKQADKAFEFLNKAVEEGFVNRQTYETDTDLAPIRTDSRFQTLLARLA